MRSIQLPFALLLAFAASPVAAADYYWNTATTTEDWVSANWNPTANTSPYDQMWLDGSTAHFNGTHQTINLNTEVSAAGLNFAGNGVTTINGTGTITLTGTGAINVSAEALISANLAGDNLNLTMIGPGGVLILNSANAFTGEVVINSGRLQVGFGGTTGWITGNVTVAAGATISFNRADTVSYGGNISGDGVLDFRANGTLTLTGDNTHTGGTIMRSGTVIAGAAHAFGSGALSVTGGSLVAGVANALGSVPVTLTGGTLALDAADALGSSVITFNGGTLDIKTFDVSLGDVSIPSGGITGTTGTVTGTSFSLGSGSISAILAGPGSFTGSGTLTRANTYTGTTSVGTLNVSILANGGMPSSIGTSSNAAANLLINTGGALQYIGSGDTTDRLFTMNGNAALRSDGTGAIQFTNGGVIAQSGIGNRTLTFSGSYNGVNTFAPILGDPTEGTTALSASGSSTWILTGNNTYSGTTTIAGAKLYFNGTKSGTGNTTVQTGTLGGTGSIAGNVSFTIPIATVLDIGDGTTNDIDDLTILGNLTIGNSTRPNFRFHFDRTAGTAAGVGFDQLLVGGNLNMGTTSVSSLTAIVVNNSGTEVFGPMTLIDASTITGTGRFAGLPNGAIVPSLAGFGGQENWFIQYDTANGNVMVIPTPEPGFGLLALGLIVWARRRH